MKINNIVTNKYFSNFSFSNKATKQTQKKSEVSFAGDYIFLKERVNFNDYREQERDKELGRTIQKIKKQISNLNKKIEKTTEEYQIQLLNEKKEKLKNDILFYRTELLERHMPFVIHISQQIDTPGFSFDEKISAGNLGLLKATAKWDPDKSSARFISYAHYWIRQQIQIEYNKNKSQIRKPSNTIVLINKISNIEFVLKEKLGRKPTLEELAAATNLPKRKLQNIINASQLSEISLDEILNTKVASKNESDLTLSDTIPSANTRTAEEIIQEQDAIKYIKQIIETLPEREKYIINHRILKDPKDSLCKVGLVLNITRERVRQLEEKALKQIRTIYNNTEK